MNEAKKDCKGEYEMMSHDNTRAQTKGMVDVSAKDETARTAMASAAVCFSEEAFEKFRTQGSPKGDILQAARIAGLQAAKSTFQLIPFCHPLSLNAVTVDFDVLEKEKKVVVRAQVKCVGWTGVEMEALSAAAVSALTIYDMMKWAAKDMTVTDIQLIKKTGGKSGDFERGAKE